MNAYRLYFNLLKSKHQSENLEGGKSTDSSKSASESENAQIDSSTNSSADSSTDSSTDLFKSEKSEKSEKYQLQPELINYLNHINENNILGYKTFSFLMSKPESEMTLEINEINNKNEICVNEYKAVIIPTNYNIFQQNNELILDQLTNYYYLQNSHEKILMYNTFKANLINMNQKYAKEINKFIAHPFMNNLNIKVSEVLVETLANIRRKVNDKYYSSSKKGITIASNLKSKFDKYKVIKLPKEIMYIIKHLSECFEEIKPKLKMNDKTHFYEMSISTELGEQILPIMCKHVYMVLNGENLYTISLECSDNGKCIYCGDALSSISFEDTTTLPTQIAELTYLLLELYGCDTSENQNSFLYIYNIIASLIPKFTTKDDVNFETKAQGVAALFCFNIIKSIPPVGNTNRIIKLITDIFILNKFDESKVEKILKSGILGDPNGIMRTLINKTDMYYYDIDIIFSYATEKIKELKEQGKMSEFNDLYLKLQTLLTKRDYALPDTKTKYKFIVNYTTLETNLKNKIELFKVYISKYCPAEGKLKHEFNKNICSNCGVDFNFKNIEEIYKKYIKSFTSKYNLKADIKMKPVHVQGFDLKNALKISNEDAKNKIKSHFNLNDIQFNELKQNVVYELPIILPTIKSWTHIFNYDFKVDDILKIIVFINNKELYTVIQPFRKQYELFENESTMVDDNDGEIVVDDD